MADRFSGRDSAGEPVEIVRFTTKGDTIIRDATGATVKPIGSEGQVAVVRSADSTGLAYENLPVLANQAITFDTYTFTDDTNPSSLVSVGGGLVPRFSAASKEEIQVDSTCPSSKGAADGQLKARIIMSAAEANDVVFDLETSINGASFSASSFTVTTASSTSEQVVTIDNSFTIAANDAISLRIARDGADANDTHTGTMDLIDVWIEFAPDGLGAFPEQSAAVSNTTPFNVPNNSATKVTGYSTLFDNGGLFDSGNSQFTVPAGMAGRYLVNFHGFFADNATGRRSVAIRVNTTNTIIDNREPGSGSGFTRGVAISGILDLVAGDDVDLEAFQDSGAGLDLTITSFSIAKLNAQVDAPGSAAGNMWVGTGDQASVELSNGVLATPVDKTEKFTTRFVATTSGDKNFTVHYRMATANAGNLRLRVNSLVTSDGDDISAALNVGSQFTITPGNDTNKHSFSPLDDPSLTLSGISAGDHVVFELERMDSGDGDTHTGTMQLVGIEVRN